ncbi:laccase domain-containing protein [Acidovorax temperans]|nr:polyphenol oxidase family protein [Acidovorax temperans]MBO0943253.1 laccase domain-containing protein [Acidovorax temperans]
MPADWLVPEWPAPAGVQALCTTRAGGVSQGPYASMNLGTHVGDDPQAVQTNRARLQAALGQSTPGARPVFLSQVHGTGVAALTASTPDNTQADACVATEAGVVCTIMVADCLPVLLAHTSGAVVGAAHAGWRGLAGQGGVGVLESAMHALFERFHALALTNKAQAAIENVASNAESLEAVARGTLAWLGPCIGSQAFEVGPEVREAFCAAGPQYSSCFVPSPTQQGKWLADLAGLARLRLQAMGVTRIYGNDSSAAWCTVTQSARFFSHRRDTALLGGSGRLAACIWRG